MASSKLFTIGNLSTHWSTDAVRKNDKQVTISIRVKDLSETNAQSISKKLLNAWAFDADGSSYTSVARLVVVCLENSEETDLMPVHKFAGLIRDNLKDVPIVSVEPFSIAKSKHDYKTRTVQVTLFWNEKPLTHKYRHLEW